MTRIILSAAAIILALALPAIAGSPPAKTRTGPDAMAASCAQLGWKGEVIANGCRNTGTGAALTCDANGQCKDYFADPRYGKIKTILDRNRVQKAPAEL